jgi:hypothetical protein
MLDELQQAGKTIVVTHDPVAPARIARHAGWPN